ncbi:twitching motility protein PilT [Serinicoccus chungangensis]|uniref:Ribonuclease VapC n=1 Tax=Serinicoccus chungangensis TaxID=767452 RepID=A0A0W8IB52_9MICO|nr:TA system VapC family ribonuclease toxin [Serinicoccus chungangensis]KUG57135.1 twitching motility protein PilT [Serinicoccus chungangensis]
MIVDANILLYAVDSTSSHHESSRAFLEERLNGDVRVGIPSQSVTAFLRISTHPRIMAEPLEPAFAATLVDDWMHAPAAWMPETNASTWAILRRLIMKDGVTGNLIPDAQLAALALQHGVPVVSADSDFARFPEVPWINPCR